MAYGMPMMRPLAKKVSVNRFPLWTHQTVESKAEEMHIVVNCAHEQRQHSALATVVV